MDLVAFWFRRDLRLHDNAGLYKALSSGNKVLPVFIFDRKILDPLPQKDARVEFIHQQVTQMHKQLTDLGSNMYVYYGTPETIWVEICDKHNLTAVYTNHDYEPYAKARDEAIQNLLSDKGVDFYTFKDQVIFEKREILTNNDSPYCVFTPYSKKWKSHLTSKHLAAYDCEQNWSEFYGGASQEVPSLESMGFKPTDSQFPDNTAEKSIIETYHETRNFPAQKGTTRIGIHLRFGTISIRALAQKAQSLNEAYLNELIWREFYMQILWNFPHVAEQPFRREYAAIPWENDEEQFHLWCEGKTGFPIVDAGMRELNETGYMHNRVRMITASFLVKDLLIDWKWGEAYFAEKLLDYELSSNNGGWQWAAGCGTDAAPYFRIFNPESQAKKFDPKFKYIQKYVPEYGTPTYPEPIVDHKAARKRTLAVYKEALDSGS